MKNSKKLFAGAGVALLCVSTASAQESGHLSAEFLKQATPLIHWPKGLEPRNVDVFVHNEGWIDAPLAVVWKNLVDASQWPTWYSNSAEVRIEGGHDTLSQGVSFRWKTFGFPIESTVDTFTPNREIGWSVHKVGFEAHHAWVLVPEKGGVPSSPRKRRRVRMLSPSGKLNPMPCTTGMTGGFRRSRPAPNARLIRPHPQPVG